MYSSEQYPGWAENKKVVATYGIAGRFIWVDH
jgi:hypothetical protein